MDYPVESPEPATSRQAAANKKPVSSLPTRMYVTRIFFLAVMCLPFGLAAQNVTISGKAIDSQTLEPLVFATVGIRGQTLGTITNLQGEFDFHFPASMRNETFVISMLGFRNFEAPVWTLLEQGQPVLIKMNKSATLLNEVVIRDSLSGGEVVRIALSRIEANYANQPFLMDGFYRDLKKVGGQYIALLESAIKLYDEDYKPPRNKFKLRERVTLVEIRRSLGYGSKFTTYFDEDNLLEDLLLHNNVRYHQFPTEEIFFESLKRQTDSYYNGREVFVVELTGDYFLKLFIDKTTYAIIRLEFQNAAESVVGKRKGLVGKFMNLRKVIEFRELQGKMYLNFITMDSRINWYDYRSGEFRFESELQQQLLINQIQPNTLERIGTVEKMRAYGLQFQDQGYNKAFWDNYNVIKESPLDKKIREDLEKEIPLEAQFQDN